MPTGVELGSAFVPIRADLDELKKDLEKAHSSVAAGLADMAKVAAVGAAAIGVAIVGIGAAAFKIGEQFDAAFDSIRVGTGATGDALESLKDDFRAVAARVPQDFGQVGQVLADLNTRTGATGEQLQGLAKQVLDFSRVTGTDAVANVASATRMFGDWSVATDQQAGALDKIFRASQATGIGVDALMGKVVQFGAPLRAMGFSLDESAAMLGKWEKEGVNSELVLGSLRIAMGNFAQAGVPMREGLDQTIAKITELGPGAEATTLAMQTFGARAGPDMAAAILEGRFALGELLDQISNGTETVSAAADDTADFAEKWSTFMHRAMLAIEPLASKVFDLAGMLLDRFAPAMEAGLAAVTPLAAAFVDWLGPAIDDAIDVLSDLASQFSVHVLPALQTVAGFIGDHAQPILAGLAAVLAAVVVPAFLAWAISAASAATATIIALAPVLVPLAAIGAAVALLKAAWDNNWGDIQGKTQAVWDFIRPIFEAVFAALATFWEEIKPELLETWRVMSAAIGTAMHEILQFIQPALDVLGRLWGVEWEGIKLALRVIWEAMKLYIGVVWDVLSGIVVAGLRLLRGDWQGAWDAIQEHFGSAWERIKTVLGGAMTALSDAMRNAGPALLGLLKQGLDAAWGGVVQSVKDGVGRISALLPHSLAEEGPLSQPVHWGDVLTGDLPAAAQAVTSAVASAARTIKDDWASAAQVMGEQHAAMTTVLATVATEFAETATTAETAMTKIRVAAKTVFDNVDRDWESMATILAERRAEMNATLEDVATDFTETAETATKAVELLDDALSRMERGQGGSAAYRAANAGASGGTDEYGNQLYFPGDTLPSGFQTQMGDQVINDQGEVRVYRGGQLIQKERSDHKADYGWDWRNDPSKNPALAAAISLLNSGQTVSTALLRELGILGPRERLANFGGGGMVPGPVGVPLMARLHGGEAVFTPEQLAAMGALTRGAGGRDGPSHAYVTIEIDGLQLARVLAPLSSYENARARATSVAGL